MPGEEANMKVAILYFKGCPNHRPALERVQAVLHEEGIFAEVAEIEVSYEQAARTAGFLGSPTIQVDGVDIEPASRSAKASGFACRCYSGGLPPTELIRAALREAQGQRV
jgi:hypothetical protein